MTGAEGVYLFRHAMLRDAAYELQLPADRAALHAHALRALEQHIPDPDRAPLAAELADHARAGIAAEPGLARTELAYLRRAAMFADKGFELAQAVALWRRVAGHEQVDTATRAFALAEIGARLHGMGQAEPAAAVLRQAKQLAEQAADISQIVVATDALLNIHATAGRFDLAEPEVELLRRCAREHPDKPDGKPSVRLRVHGALGRFFDTAGDTATARSEYEAAIALAEAEGQHHMAAVCRVNLAGLLGESGDLAGALAMLRRARESLEISGILRPLAICVGNIGWVEVQLDRPDEAEASLRHAANLCRQIGARFDLATVLGNLGNALADQTRYDEAEALLTEALALCREAGQRRHEGIVLGDLALVRTRSGNPQQGAELARQAIAINTGFNNLRSVVVARQALANALALMGAAEESERELRAGLETARVINQPRWVCLLAWSLAMLLKDTGRQAEFHAALDECVAAANRVGMTEYVNKAAALRG